MFFYAFPWRPLRQCIHFWTSWEHFKHGVGLRGCVGSNDYVQKIITITKKENYGNNGITNSEAWYQYSLGNFVKADSALPSKWILSMQSVQLLILVKWGNDGLLQAYDGTMLVNDGEMSIWLLFTLISRSSTSISPSLKSILPLLALRKPAFAHLTIIEKLHQLLWNIVGILEQCCPNLASSIQQCVF